MTTQDTIKDLLRTVQSISAVTSKKKQQISNFLLSLYQRQPEAISSCKAFVSSILLSLKTTSEDLDDISSKGQHLQNLLEYNQGQVFRAIDLSTPQKVIVINQYENMIKQQLFTEETKGEKFDYFQKNREWEERVKSLNTSINKCLEHAERNL